VEPTKCHAVSVYNNQTIEQVLFQRVKTSMSNLELPLEPNSDYQWSFDAYDEGGNIIASGYVGSFRTKLVKPFGLSFLGEPII
jgi:hypothetical protein